MFAHDSTAFYIGNTVNEALLNIQKEITDLNFWASLILWPFIPQDWTYVAV